ncbi:MAG: cbb3-type cytochrome c oxidase subunit 3 [Rhizobiaceae bacterium]|nr:cbb3-type cytochrome c oxidase subunit 3 [Rhizobiaceae bacterium]MCV0407437.1 cbb3-type cytochrome c oxidase subunit 3 [Rhizobiaceae bacterium]
METYTAMRQFADSWALLAMALFFIGVVMFAFRPGSRCKAEQAASIPLNDEHAEPRQ